MNLREYKKLQARRSHPKDYDQVRDRIDQDLEFCLQHAEIRPGGYVLDLGTRDGYLVQRLSEHGFDAGGGAGLCSYLDKCASIDLNPATDPNVFVDLEKGNLPFVSNSFDCVVCADVLEHLENLHHIFAESVRVSRQYLIISLPNNWLSGRAIICRGSHTRSMKRYGLPIEKPFDRHRWFFGYTEAEDFIYGMATRMNLQVMQCEPYFGARNQIKAALLRPWMSSRRLHNLFASALWAILKVVNE